MTNFEHIKGISLKRINSMTIESFAAKLSTEHNCENCPLDGKCGVGTEADTLEEMIRLFNSCYKAIREWLESEADEDD